MKFVDKQLAIKLKEKGFDRPCFAYYRNDELIMNHTSIHLPFGGNVYDTMFSSNGLCEDDAVDAPTIEQVLEWLREEKGVLLAIGYNKRKKYRYVVISITYNGEEPDIFEFGFNTYDDAILAGVNFIVEHLI